RSSPPSTRNRFHVLPRSLVTITTPFDPHTQTVPSWPSPGALTARRLVSIPELRMLQVSAPAETAKTAGKASSEQMREQVMPVILASILPPTCSLGYGEIASLEKKKGGPPRKFGNGPPKGLHAGTSSPSNWSKR